MSMRRYFTTVNAKTICYKTIYSAINILWLPLSTGQFSATLPGLYPCHPCAEKYINTLQSLGVCALCYRLSFFFLCTAV